MNKPVKELKILSGSTFEMVKKYKYLLILSCLFLMHIILFNVYMNRALSSNEFNRLSAYVRSKILSHYELTSGIKLTYRINGEDYKARAKNIYEIINIPLLQPEIDRLISKAYHCAFLSSCVYIFLLYFVFNRKKAAEIELKNREIKAKKNPLEPPVRNILAEKNSDKKFINKKSMNGKELKVDPEMPSAFPIIKPEIHKKPDSIIDKNINNDDDDNGLSEEDFLL
jgi:hypothetical protein